jgi:hypothetical protein
VLPESLDPDVLRTAIVVGLVVLLVLAFLVLRLVQKMVLRVVVLGALAGLAAFGWYERAELRDCVPNCTCRVLGYDVQTPGCPTPTG